MVSAVYGVVHAVSIDGNSVRVKSLALLAPYMHAGSQGLELGAVGCV